MSTAVEIRTFAGSMHFQACTRYLTSVAVRLMLGRDGCVVVDVAWYDM